MRTTPTIPAASRAAMTLGLVLACGPAALASGPEAVPVVSGSNHQALFAIALDGRQGLAVGVGGEVLVSGDGGATWTPEAGVPSDKSLLGLAVAGGKALAVGQSGLILRRGRDGAWSTADSGTTERLFGVDFNEAGTAVAVGSFGRIVLSADGGATWRSVAPAWADASFTEQGMEPHLYAVEVATDGTITVAGEFGLVLRSRDQGQTWQVLHRGEASVFALHLRDDDIGYAVGQGGMILRTADGGESWSDVTSGSNANLLGVDTAPTGQVMVTAMRDMLVSDDGIVWTRLATGDFGSAWYSGVAVLAGEPRLTGLVVGHAGRIVRVSD
jgi:photosystem II stability/assembly factor-like uncharacterized protein